MSEWQPIETAPFTTNWRDAPIWVLVFDSVEGQAVARLLKEGPFSRDDGSEYWCIGWRANGSSGHECENDLLNITHWKALEPGPDTSRADEP